MAASMDFSSITITELAAIMAAHLTKWDIDVVLVGGLAVEIYTENLYLTKDIDMVNTNYRTPSRLQKAMADLAFYKKGRIYVNETTDITVEFPPGPLSVGDELVKETVIVQVSSGHIPILSVNDVVKDRLAAFVHWKDRQSLIQAVAVLLKHQLKPHTFQKFCLREGAEVEYDLLNKFYLAAKANNLEQMERLETLLTKILLDEIS